MRRSSVIFPSDISDVRWLPPAGGEQQISISGGFPISTGGGGCHFQRKNSITLIKKSLIGEKKSLQMSLCIRSLQRAKNLLMTLTKRKKNLLISERKNF